MGSSVGVKGSKWSSLGSTLFQGVTGSAAGRGCIDRSFRFTVLELGAAAHEMMGNGYPYQNREQTVANCEGKGKALLRTPELAVEFYLSVRLRSLGRGSVPRMSKLPPAPRAGFSEFLNKRLRSTQAIRSSVNSIPSPYVCLPPPPIGLSSSWLTHGIVTASTLHVPESRIGGRISYLYHLVSDRC